MKRLWLSLAIAFGISNSVFAIDRLTIISPHRKSIQDEYVPAFEKFYAVKYGVEIEVDWLDQGGTENDLRYVFSKYTNGAKTSGIDVFWGGGDITFMDLEEHKVLEPYALPSALAKEIPAKVLGVPLRSPSNSWHATALSSFGIFYNRRLLKFQNLKEPTSWDSLADPAYINNIAVADPRHSGTSLVMSIIVLEALGWEKGWETLFAIAGNTKVFAQNSSDPIKNVVSGDGSLATAVDFYANAQVDLLGTDNLGFLMPPKQTIFNSDPIAILKGAPNRKIAERFVDYVLSVEGQKLFFLAKGAPGGPTGSYLGRMGVNPVAYNDQKLPPTSVNPYKVTGGSLTIDFGKMTKMKRIVGDLIGAIHIDTHEDLKTAWRALIKKGMPAKEFSALSAPPFPQKEFDVLIKKWDDTAFRTATINAWVHAAQARYRAANS